MNEIITQKERLISKVQIAKKQEKEKWENSKEKLIGKVPFRGAKHIIWDQLAMKLLNLNNILFLCRRNM